MPGDHDKAVRVLLEKVFNAVSQAEATDQIGAGMYERSAERKTCCKGYRIRQLSTRVGSLTLHVPKLRNGTFSTEERFQRFQRSEQALQLALMEMYLQGVSTRKVQRITEELCGTSLSNSTVSHLGKQLDGQVTAVFGLPEPYRKRLRRSNRIEGLNGEYRRRERVIRIFPNEDSLLRLMGSLLAEHHENGSSGHLCFNMNTDWQARQEMVTADESNQMEGGT